MIRIAVLASGAGTTLKSIIRHEVPLELVLADRYCPAQDIAAADQVPTELVDRTKFGYAPGVGEEWDRRGFTIAVVAVLKRYEIEVVAMAGFFTILHEVIFEDYEGRVLNIHPSLLPAHRGEFAVRDALAAGVSETGSTVHIATRVLDDHRYILRQVRVAVRPDDDVDALWERIKKQERTLYPRVLQDILLGDIDLAEVMRRPR